MKINHNMSAMIANNQLQINENGLSNSIERLSSGLKLNHASDDAAGVAIATKMRAQIKGLDQASQNASDGISVVETTDGALQEVTNMLQRMRELSVQAANSGVYSQEDQEAIQAEIESLTEEIGRISRDTEFNTKKLLDGSLDQRVYTNSRSISKIDISDSVASANYEITMTQDARQAVIFGDTVSTTTNPPIPAGVISINGVEVEITEGQDMDSVFQSLREAAEKAEVNLFAVDVNDTNTSNLTGKAEDAGYIPADFRPGNRLVMVSDRYGSSAEIKITTTNDDLTTYLGIPHSAIVKGIDAQLELGDGFSKQASYTCDGTEVSITDRNGFKITFEAGVGTAGTTYSDLNTQAAEGTTENNVLSSTTTGMPTYDLNFEVTDIGTMTLQIGANEDQVMEVRIPSISPELLGIDKINVCTVTGADRAITSYDKAIAKVSESRSRLGAFQNRLEHAVSSLDATEENMTAALSRIEDVDMASEMSTYTQFTVLQQAATAVLAQANDIPQQALQLLQ